MGKLASVLPSLAWAENGMAAAIWCGWQACLCLAVERAGRELSLCRLGCDTSECLPVCLSICVHVGTSMAGLGLLWAFVGVREGKAGGLPWGWGQGAGECWVCVSWSLSKGVQGP